ncbi:MAG: hypothetical protein HY043_15835, partial [Verrucomicrobia bacterium]|nr:hypothetical protein [Verrucomicrobiota bacterium]
MKRMRLALSLAVICPLLALSLRAQDATQTAPAADAPVIVKTETLPPVFLDLGQNQQTVQTTTLLTDANGVVTTNVGSYIELAAGMHYVGPKGEYLPAVAEFELLGGNAVARRTAFSVILSPSPTDAQPVDILLPDGSRLVNRCAGLGWFDAATGKSVLFAEPRAVAGVLSPTLDELIYPDCFDHITASLRYRLTIGGLEADVILGSQPPTPQSFGLNPDTCRLTVMTELLQSPPATLDVRVLKEETDPAVRAAMAEPDFIDATIDFGSMLLPPGVALNLGDQLTAEELEDAIPVAKHLESSAGRTFLFEDVLLSDLAPLLKDLPAAPQAGLKSTNATRVAAVASPGRVSVPASPDFGHGLHGLSPIQSVPSVESVSDDQRRLTSAAAIEGSAGGSLAGVIGSTNHDSFSAMFAARTRRTAAGTAALPNLGRAAVASGSNIIRDVADNVSPGKDAPASDPLAGTGGASVLASQSAPSPALRAPSPIGWERAGVR